jgi:nucleoside-diphosphate-sugar epimerase
MSDRVFITGVTGYLGSAIAARFAHANYEVFGLTRNPERAPALTAKRMTPVIGSLGKPETFLGALKNCDVVVHVAFDAADVANQDRLALDAIRTSVLDGRVRTVLYTSGAWVHGDTHGRTIDESAPLNPLDLVRWRKAHESVAMDLSEHEARVMILRPATVYGGAKGTIGAMFAEAHNHRVVHYPGSGGQYWGLIHRDDLADAYLHTAQHGKTGEAYLLTDGSTFTVHQLADAIAQATGASALPRDPDEVVRKLGLFGRALLASQKIDSSKARRELGWTPKHVSFVDEVQALDQEWLASRGTPVA